MDDRRTALVTGAARGIGRACALRLVTDEYDLALLDIGESVPEIRYDLGNRAQLRTTSSLCEESGSTVVELRADVRQAEAVETMVLKAVERLGGIDVVVNCAGVVTSSGALVHEVSLDEWHAVVDINLSGCWNVIRAVAPHMISRNRGVIVNIASTAGIRAYGAAAPYVASKHGLVGLTRAAAMDLGRFGIRVNALCPGAVEDDPELSGSLLGTIADSMGMDSATYSEVPRSRQALDQLVPAGEVAAAVAWLASRDATSVTGAVVAIDGGFSA